MPLYEVDIKLTLEDVDLAEAEEFATYMLESTADYFGVDVQSHEVKEIINNGK